MNRYSNYHTHTHFCDGADSPEAIVREALRLGCPEIGFSGHSYLPEDTGSMSPENTAAYRRNSSPERKICRTDQGSSRHRTGLLF